MTDQKFIDGALIHTVRSFEAYGKFIGKMVELEMDRRYRVFFNDDGSIGHQMMRVRAGKYGTLTWRKAGRNGLPVIIQRVARKAHDGQA